MESQEFWFAPVYKNRDPLPKLEVLSFALPSDFQEVFLPSLKDKVIAILLTHPEVKEEEKSHIEMLEEVAKETRHLRYFVLDIGTYENLASDYFKVDEIPKLAFIKPYAQQAPEIIGLESAAEVIGKIKALNEEMENKFQAMKGIVFEEITKLVNSQKTFAFIKGSPSNPRCKFSRKLLGSWEGLPVMESGLATEDILEKGVFRSWLPFFTQWPTFPQIFVDGKFVGGVDVVTEMIENE